MELFVGTSAHIFPMGTKRSLQTPPQKASVPWNAFVSHQQQCLQMSKSFQKAQVKHPHFLGARLNPLAHLNCYRHRGTPDFPTSAESVCLLRDKGKPPAHSPGSCRRGVRSPLCTICPWGSSAVCGRKRERERSQGSSSSPSLGERRESHRALPKLAEPRGTPHCQRASSGDNPHTDAWRARSTVGTCGGCPRTERLPQSTEGGGSQGTASPCRLPGRPRRSCWEKLGAAAEHRLICHHGNSQPGSAAVSGGVGKGCCW